MTAWSTPLDEEPEATNAADVPAGDKRAVNWVIVANTMGLLAAQLMAGRLQADGIPARAWQEGPASVFALTVGILGTGHVAVPEEFAEQAEAILAVEYPAVEDDEEEEEGEDSADTWVDDADAPDFTP